MCRKKKKNKYKVPEPPTWRPTGTSSRKPPTSGPKVRNLVQQLGLCKEASVPGFRFLDYAKVDLNPKIPFGEINHPWALADFGVVKKRNPGLNTLSKASLHRGTRQNPLEGRTPAETNARQPTSRHEFPVAPRDTRDLESAEDPRGHACQPLAGDLAGDPGARIPLNFSHSFGDCASLPLPLTQAPALRRKQLRRRAKSPPKTSKDKHA